MEYAPSDNKTLTKEEEAARGGEIDKETPEEVADNETDEFSTEKQNYKK